MASYFYKGTTQQKSVNHQNKVVALKVDLNLAEPVSKLAEATASPDGSFLLQWDDWAGRVIIGAADDDNTIKLNAIFKDFIVGQEAVDVGVTQAPVYVILQDNDDTGISVTQSPVYPIINNTNTGIHITQAPVYVIKSLRFNLNNDVPETPLFNLVKEVE